MATWNLKELREIAKDCQGNQKKKELVEFLDSFDWKNKATYYHLLQADESIKKFSDLEMDEVFDRLVLNDEEINLSFKIREISLVSSVLTANTLTEVLAQVLNMVLLGSVLKVNDVTSYKVLKKMSSGTLKSKFTALLDSDENKYISAFANTTKHLNLVKPEYHLSYDDKYHCVRFKEFSYKNKPFPAICDVELIKTIKNHRSKCVEFGCSINDKLR
jgi:hypothetical protein